MAKERVMRRHRRNVSRQARLSDRNSVEKQLSAAVAPLFESLEARRLLNGALDNTFDVDGKLTTDFGGTESGEAVAVQSDGRIVVVGASGSSFAIARYNADGSADTTFDTDGKATTAIGSLAHATSVAIQNDGRIVVGGYAVVGSSVDFALARYNTDGSLDTNFSGDGLATVDFAGRTDRAYSVAVQADGSVVAAGLATTGPATTNEDFGLIRLDSGGNLDAGFSGGKVTTNFGGADSVYALVLDGTKLVAAGGSAGNFAVARYTSSGALDTSFNGTGRVTTTFAAGAAQAGGIAIDGSGNYVVAGGAGNDFGVARYSSAGALDAGFGTLGKTTTDFAGDFDQAKAVTVQANGGIVLAGSATVGGNASFAVARYESDGSLDTNGFGAGTGKVTTNFSAGDDSGNGMTTQAADGKIIVAGTRGSTDDFAVARYEINNAPVLSTTSTSLPSISEDPLTNTGQDVASFIGGLTITDADANAVKGIAISAVDDTNGSWEFSTDSGGSWNAISPVSATSALVLSNSSANRIRFVPNADFNTDIGPAPTITYRAWDQYPSGAITGSKVDASSTGGFAAFSAASGTADITVSAVNDAPANNVPFAQQVSTGGTLVFSAGNTNPIVISDVDAASDDVQVALSVAHGKVTLSTLAGLSIDAGANNSASITVRGTLTALNAALSGMTYMPTSGYTGMDSLSIGTSDLGHNPPPAKTDADVVNITVNPLTSTVYADDNWSITNDVGPTGLSYGDTVQDGANGPFTFGVEAFDTVQGGVNFVTSGGTVHVLAGSYHEDVSVNHPVSLLGEGLASTTLSGPIGGGGATIQVAAGSVLIDGFTITRDGNNPTDWNGALNSVGVAVQGQGNFAEVRNNRFFGNRSGIDINNSNGNSIHNNIIDDNRTGLIFRNQTDNTTFVENQVTNNWTVGLLFLDGSGGTNSPLQQALNSTFSNNNFSGNWYGQIVDRQTGGSLPAPGTTSLKDFSGNWFGTTAPVITTANSTEPGYAAQIPVAYGGTAVPPGGQPDIAGPASANFDITPLLDSGTDTNVETTPGRGTIGFQGDHATLDVTAAGAQTGTTGRVQEGVDRVNSGGTVNVQAGSYLDNVTVNKSVLLSGASQATTFVRPAISSITSDPITGSAIMRVQSDNVHITGLTLDGDNPAITSGEVHGGADIDATAGIVTAYDVSGAYDNTEIDHLTVENIYLRGIQLRTTGTFNIHDNTVDNVQGDVDLSIAIFNRNGGGVISGNTVMNTPDAISANHSRGTQFLNNNISHSLSGIHTDNSRDSGGTSTDVISGNDISLGNDYGVPPSRGIWAFVPYQNVTIDNNDITGVGTGIGAYGSGAATGTVTIDHNSVDLGNAANSIGVEISTTIPFGFGSANVNATVQNDNTIANAATGIAVHQDVGFVVTANITGNDDSIHGNVIGIDVDAGSATISTNHIFDNTTGIRLTNGGSASVSSNDFSGATSNGTDIRMDASAGALSSVTGNTFAATGFFIDNVSTQDVTALASSNSFAGLTNNFRIEDQIHHRVDTDISASTGLVTWVSGNLYITDAGTDHSIQRGVDAASAGNTINLETGTFDEATNVNKSVTITGAGQSPVVTRTSGSNQKLFSIAAQNVTITDLGMQVNRPFAVAGVYADTSVTGNFNGLTVSNNVIRSVGSGGSLPGVLGGATSSAGIALLGTAAQSAAISNNNVKADNDITPTSVFGRGIWLGGITATVQNNPAVAGLAQDLLLSAMASGTTTVSGNSFFGAGVDVSSPSAGSIVNVSTNTFSPASTLFPQSLIVKANTDGTVNVTSNTFSGHNNTGVFVGASKNVLVKDNIFTPNASSTNYSHVVVSTGYPTNSGFVNVPDQSVTIQGNTFNGAGGASGRALDFQNVNSAAGNGMASVTLGGAGALANKYQANLTEFMRLTPTFTAPHPAAGTTAYTPAPFNFNLDATNETFDVGAGLQTPGTMSVAQLGTLETKIYHKIDNASVGLVNFGGSNIYVTPATSPTPTDNDYTRIANALAAASSGYTINLTGTFDWTETNAAASWAKGNDGLAGTTNDNYSLLVPANLNNVTVTAPGGLGSAEIKGPGDLPTENLEGVFVFDGGDNKNWTISNLRIVDFDLSIGMFSGAGGSDAFDNTTITNNYIRIPTDLSATAASADNLQNIGIQYAFGKNQTISNNTIEIAGTGTSNSGAGDFASSVGMQSNTSGGDVYDGLQITGNIINVTGAQSADPEVVLGIWENAHAHLSDITISNNQFHNTSGSNNPALNLQRAFRVTSHSSNTTTVAYSGNVVDGANIGFQWLSGSNFSGNQPVQLTSNTLTDVNTGILVQSNGSATLAGNSLTNSGGVGTGVSVAAGSSAQINGTTNENAIAGFATGILASGSVTVTGNDASIHGNAVGIDVNGGNATITGNHIYDNTIGIRVQNSGTASIDDNEFDGGAGADNGTDLKLINSPGVVTVGSTTPNNFAGDTFFIDDQSTQNIDATNNTFDEIGADKNFRIEDKMHHRMDDDLALTNGLVTWTNDFYVTSAGTDHSIQRGVDVASNGSIVNVEAGLYVENVTVTKEVEIKGAGEASTTVVPSFAGANTGGGSISPGSSNIFLVQANNVTIDNLTIDGDNTSLSGATSVNVGGANIDARNGIITDHTVGTFNNLNVNHVTVKNMYLRGIYASSGGTFDFQHDTVQNVQADPASIAMFNFGGAGIMAHNVVSDASDAISANHSRGTQFIDNTVTNSGSGIHSDNSGDGGGSPDLIDSNHVSNSTAGGYGIWTFVSYQAITVQNNDVTNVDVGLASFGVQSGPAPQFINNVVDSAGRAGAIGALITTEDIGFGDFNVAADFSGNTLKNGDVGLQLNRTGTATNAVTLSGDQIFGNGVGIQNGGGVLTTGPGPADGGSLNASNAHVYDNATGIILAGGGTATLNNTNFAGGTSNTTDLRLDSDAGTLTFGGTANAFAASSTYIDNRSPQNIDATAQLFGGSLGSGMSLTQLYATEDKIIHAIDLPGAGFVRVKAANVYVTPSSFVTPTTTAPSIARGVNAASANDTVNIEAGSYTLTGNITLDKSITLLGPNAGNSPRNGGPSRVAEAVIDGGAPGAFTGSSGFVFNLQPGITSLNVTGLKFTNFDGNMFASSLVPVTSINLHQNIFDANNGGLFYKFDTTPATVSITDNLISNQSMTGANSALLFLGYLTNSHIDDNEVTNAPARELLNVFGTLNNSTVDGNKLTNANGVAAIFADVTGLEIKTNTLSNVTGNAIYVGTNNGHTVSNLDIEDNVVTTATGSGIIVAADTAAAASISGVTIKNNSISGTANYGIRIDTTQNGTATVSNVDIEDNQLTDNTFSPILVYSRPNPSSGFNAVSGITIAGNTISENASVLTAGTFRLIDLRNVAGTTDIHRNLITVTGTLPGPTDAVQAIGIRGSRTGTVNIYENRIDGGGTVHNNAPTIPVAGIAILSNDASTGAIPSSAVIIVHNNFIRNFEDGVTVRDGVAGVYGGLAAGTDVRINKNDLSSNSQFGIRSGAAGAQIDGGFNWWGAASGPSGAGTGSGSAVSVNVDFNPWVTVGTDVGGDPTDGFQPDLSQLSTSGLSISGAATTDEGLVYTLNYNNDGDPDLAGVNKWIIDWGDGNTDTFNVAAGSSGTFTHTYADGPNNWTISASAMDNTNTYAIASTVALAVNNVAPTGTLGNGGAVNEGSTGSVSFSGQLDPSVPDTSAGFHYAYDFNNDGTFEVGDGTYAGSGTSSNATVPASFLDDGNGSRTVKARIIDKDGGLTDYTTTITINNVAPTATLGNGGAVNEGSTGSVSFSAQFDPSTADTTAGFHYAYDFDNNGTFELGDGTYAGSGTTDNATVPASFLLDGPFTRTVKARIIDKDGGFTDYTTNIVVNNVEPKIAVSGAATTPEGSVYTLSLGAITDPGTDTVFRYIINWDDGSFDDITGNPVSTNHTHTYMDGPATRNITISLFDEDAPTPHANAGNPDPLVVSVTNVAPTATFFNGGAVSEGSAGLVGFTGEADPSGPDTTAGFKYSYDFNNDNNFEIVDSTSNSASVPASFLADGPGSRIVHGRIKDKDGGFTDYTTTITINNVTPVVNAGPDANVNATQLFTQTGNFTDPGADSPWIGRVDYDLQLGDTFATADPLSLSGHNFTLSHTYNTPGIYQVRVYIQDKDGAIGTDDLFVTVGGTPTFQVATFGSNASGFTATFNRSADTSVLNIYDGLNGIMPSSEVSDITLVGNVVGPVRGSAIWDPTTNTIRFVKTGGLLAADTYTVTLRSSASGFKDNGGALLDGDGNGTDGDNYSTTFVIAAPAGRVLSVPDFTRGPDSLSNINLPNTSTDGIPVRISDGALVRSVDFTLTYDPNLLSITNVQKAAGLPADWSVTFNNTIPGVLAVTVFGTTTDLSAGAQNLVKITAHVPDGAAYGAAEALVVSGITVSKNDATTLASVGDVAVHKAVYFGDVDADRQYTGFDSGLISRVVVTLDNGFHATPLVDPVIVADIDGSGGLTGIDASFVAQKSVALPRPEIPDLPASLPPLVGGGVDPQINGGTGLVGKPGDVLNIPLTIDDATNLLGFNVTVNYNQAQLLIGAADVTLGALLDGAGHWNMTVNANNPDKVLISFFRDNGEPMTSGSGTIADLAVHIKPSAVSGHEVLDATGPASVGGLAFQYGDGGLDIDAVGPSQPVSDYLVETVPTAPMQMDFQFAEDVSATLGVNDLTLTNLTTSSVINASFIQLSYNSLTNVATFTFPGLPNGILPDGEYEARINGAGVTDGVGNPLTGGDAVLNFFFLEADANRDGTVDTLDFNALASHFGLSGMLFSQGDFNYDGVVDTVDFNILGNEYANHIPASPGSAPASAAPAGGNSGLFSSIEVSKDDDVLLPSDLIG
jgi:uncharacterized delta-60 repeat protein